VHRNWLERWESDSRTLSRWRQEARSLPNVIDKLKRAGREWTVEQKARVLAEASKLDGEELIAYLEREAVKLAEYEQWRIALDEGGPSSVSTNRRIRELERELARKEKALAEAAALLILKKKSGVTLRGGRGRRHEREEREVILELIAKAQTSGVRLAPACGVLGISARTIERWRVEPEAGDRRCGRMCLAHPQCTGRLARIRCGAQRRCFAR